MPAQRPRASFEPILPHFDLKTLVEATPNFQYVDRISCDMIDQQGLPAFEKLVLLHVIIGGKPLVIDGFEDRLDPWTFTPNWLRDNCGEKVETACNLATKDILQLTMGHYLRNMGLLTNQFFDKPDAWKEKNRQRVYLKDIDCPTVWWDKLKEHIPSILCYLNETTGDAGGPDTAARAGDLMSSLPQDMRAENLMCYIGHEGTYTPAHREMCASLGHNIMVEASTAVSDDGKVEKPGSSIWFMTESKDRHLVSEYWLSVLGHDIEVESHFAQVIAWKKAPFSVYVVEQRPGDLILIPPLAPHQVWNRGTRTMKVAWNRTTMETLEMAMHEALPRSRIVCRDEQYKNKAIIYYTLQKYGGLLSMAHSHASSLPADAARRIMYTGKVKQLFKDFKRLFGLYRQVLVSEMFNPEDSDAPKTMQYLPFDSNVTCAYCRGNIFNRFLTCPSCKNALGHDAEDDPYDVCLDCYALGRSCACISNLKWAEQFRWKELATKYESWRQLIVAFEGDPDKAPLPLNEERKLCNKKTLAEVCKEQLKRRPWKNPSKEEKESEAEDEEEEIVVGDDGMVKRLAKKRSKAWLKNNSPCHICCHRHPNWRMAACTTCDRWWCYGTLFRGWDKMPIAIMENPNWSCPHCLGICFAGACRREGKMQPYEPKGTLLGHDTKKVADVRSVEALVDFSVSNLNWLKEDKAQNQTESSRMQRAKADADRAKREDASIGHEEEDEELGEVEQTRVDYEYSPPGQTPIDPALTNGNVDEDVYFASRLQQINAALPPPSAMMAGAPAVSAPDGYAPASDAGYVPQTAHMSASGYPEPYPPGGIEPQNDEERLPFGDFSRKRPRDDDDDDDEAIRMTKSSKVKNPRLSAAGFRSTDLADSTSSKAKNEAQRQFEREKERKALETAKVQGRYIMMQAALRGKRRLVKMKVPGARLAQMLAQRAASAAEAAGTVMHDVDHGAEDPSAQQLQTEASADAELNLLTSDIAPKKAKDTKQYQKQREQVGLVITSKTRKALIPVEKDDSYGHHTSQRNALTKKSGPGDKRRSRYAPVQYEEVDVGSEEDDEDNEDVYSTYGASAGATRETQKRTLPSYLRDRDTNTDAFPNELPEDSRVRGHKSRQLASTLSKRKAVSLQSRTRNGTPKNEQAPTRPSKLTVEEDNRRAKLQALELLDDGDVYEAGAGGSGTFDRDKGRQEDRDFEDHYVELESDDEVDSVPARRAAPL